MRKSPRLKVAAKSFILQPPDDQPLRAASHVDGRLFLRNACLSIAEAIGSIDRGAYTWACIKLYYSCFYSARAWLALSDEIHIYLDRTPAYLTIRSGSQVTTGKGNSHEFVFNRFSSRFGQLGLLSQDIEADHPFDWLRSKREQVQYSVDGFADPAIHTLFAHWVRGKPRDLMNFYLTIPESAADYASIFDAGHAMIAFPLRLLGDLLAAARQNHGFSLAARQLQHCRSLCRVNGHPVAQFNAMVG